MGRSAPEDAIAARLLRRRYMANTLLGLAILLGAVLMLCPPALQSLYPVCPIHQYLGILCPGCGATRALTALLHSRLSEALRLNALFVLLLPFALAVLIESYRRALRAGTFRWPQPPAAALYATLAAAAVFTVARNLP
jgi:Protein of unknown function (DUF2752)